MSVPPRKEQKNVAPEDAWRVFRILSEFVRGFETMADLGPSVSIFGSSRMQSDHDYYTIAQKVSTKIAERGFSVISGGGPGIMEAANKGAQNVHVPSCGLGIDIPLEEEHNDYIDPKYHLQFRYFFVRKVMFIRYAQALVFLPGGLGTLDELFEAITLIQTKKINPIPIYLMITSFWEPLLDWIKQGPIKTHSFISTEDLDSFILSDDPDTVAKDIEKHYNDRTTTETFEI